MNHLKVLLWHYSFRAWLFIGRVFAGRYAYLTPCGTYKERDSSCDVPTVPGGKVIRVMHWRVSDHAYEVTEFLGRARRALDEVPATFRNLATISFSADAYVEDWEDGDAKVGDIYLDMEYVDFTPTVKP